MIWVYKKNIRLTENDFNLSSRSELIDTLHVKAVTWPGPKIKSLLELEQTDNWITTLIACVVRINYESGVS